MPEHLSKEQDIPLRAGDRVEVGTPGGGGYGDPLQRPAETVLHEVRQGYYTAEQARDRFGVALSADGASIDAEATGKLRQGGA